MLLSPRSFRMKVNGSFYPPSSSGVGTLPTRPDKPLPRRTRRFDTPKQVRTHLNILILRQHSPLLRVFSTHPAFRECRQPSDHGRSPGKRRLLFSLVLGELSLPVPDTAR